jgi:hypothetical protein
MAARHARKNVAENVPRFSAQESHGAKIYEAIGGEMTGMTFSLEDEDYANSARQLEGIVESAVSRHRTEVIKGDGVAHGRVRKRPTKRLTRGKLRSKTSLILLMNFRSC